MEQGVNPDCLFETSWEVCNKVGGIYTVLATRAKLLNSAYRRRLFFVGPNIKAVVDNPYFNESSTALKDWRRAFKKDTGLSVKCGTWQIPGKPTAILIDYKPLFDKKDAIYAKFWEAYGVDSLHGYGDYDDSSLFGYAAGMAIEHFVDFNDLRKKDVVAQFHEWQTGFGELYLRLYAPHVATIFTTHATGIGRSIAEHEKPLYSKLWAFNGNQMAEELNLQSKHSAERTAAWNADCFSTVSEITAKECTQLLDKKPDIILPNGYDSSIIPKNMNFRIGRRDAREKLLEVAGALLGERIENDDVLLIGTSGRYEYKNKGINVFIDAMKLLGTHADTLKKEILAFIMVPAWTMGPDLDLLKRIKTFAPMDTETKIYTTHKLYQPDTDPVMNQLRGIEHLNEKGQKVRFVFVPTYLEGRDGVFDIPYQQLIMGFDLTIFPSYYEPWGYTPMESAALSIPTITTDLAGFGMWIKDHTQDLDIENGVSVVHRTDDNYHDVVKQIEAEAYHFCSMNYKVLKTTKKRAQALAQTCDWTHFIAYYKQAYEIALRKRDERLNPKQ